MTQLLYPDPVARLLTLGRPDQDMDYLALGLTAGHIPDLIRLATDEDLRWGEEADEPALWGPIHAWQALGQLRAAEAVEPLLTQLRFIDEEDDDWAGEELPRVLGQIGLAALPALGRYLADEAHGLWASAAAVNALEQIAEAHPASGPECAAILRRRLERYQANDPTLNADLIYALAKLRVTEAAPLMEQAFDAGRVDETVGGDWEDIQILLGLKEKRETPRRRSPLDDMLARMTEKLAAPPESPRPVPEAIQSWNAQVERRKLEKRLREPRKKRRGKRGR